MRYHPADEEYTSPEVFHRRFSAYDAIAWADPYCGCIVADGRWTAPSVGASPTATGAAGGGLDGRDPAAVEGARTCGGRRGGTGVERVLVSPGAAVGCTPGAEPARGADGSGTMMLIAGIDWEFGKV